MQPKDYLEWKGETPKVFAKTLGITPTKLNQYLYGKTVPRKGMMMKIFLVTEGHVDANGFNGTTRDVIEKKLLEITRLTKLTGAKQ
jgi:phage antirepressor YoqD-like protein